MISLSRIFGSFKFDLAFILYCNVTPFADSYLPFSAGFIYQKLPMQNYRLQPCFAIGYDTPENYRKRYYRGELPKKQTFESRILSTEPKFVQKRRQLSDNKDTYENVTTFEKEKNEKS